VAGEAVVQFNAKAIWQLNRICKAISDMQCAEMEKKLRDVSDFFAVDFRGGWIRNPVEASGT
jgi:hypothetical protein